MKQYFAKYLPVEGEIKVGDKVESESSGRTKVTVTSITEKGDYVTDERDWYEPDSYFVLPKEKAKKFSKTLFLCSRDIEVGDKFRHYHIDPKKSAELRKPIHDFNNLAKEEDICDKVEDGEVWWSRDSDYFSYRVNFATAIEGTFKVIGEISPNAIWVKEGDEFDESEVQYLKKERIAYLECFFLEEEYSNEIEQAEVREYTWKDENSKPWWYDNDSNPNILSYKGILYLYGPNGHRKDTLESLKLYTPENIRVKILCPTCKTFH